MIRIPGILCFIFLLFVVLIFWQCSYKPYQEFDRDIKKPDSATIGIILTPTDSVYTLYESANLQYDLQTFGLTIYRVKFYMDDQFLYENTLQTGTIHIDYYKYSLGTHWLSMVVTTSTNSGSLADILHAEGFVFSKKWKIIFAHADPPEPCEITRIKDSAGTATIFWEKYKGVAFKNYYVYKVSTANPGYYGEIIKTISSSDTTCFSDPTYVGGTTYYSIEVISSGGHAYSYFYLHETNLSNLHVTWLGGSKVKLTWTPCIFYKNFKQYTIVSDALTSDPVYTSDTIGKNWIICDKGVFGGSNKFNIYVDSKSPSYSYDFRNHSEAEVTVGQVFPAFEILYNNAVNNTVYLLDNYYNLTKVNSATGQVLGIISLPYGTDWCNISPQDNLIISPGSYSYQKINPQVFSGYTTLQMPSNTSVCESPLSGAGLGMARVEWPYYGNMVFDFMNNSTVFAKDLDELNCGKISPDGNYMMNDFWYDTSVTCYKIENNDFIMKWKYHADLYDFIPNSSYVMLFNETTNQVKIKELASAQVVRSFQIDAGGTYQDADPKNPLILFSYNNYDPTQSKVKVYNYITGKKAFEILTMMIDWSSFALQDSTIYHGRGYKIKMQ